MNQEQSSAHPQNGIVFGQTRAVTCTIDNQLGGDITLASYSPSSDTGGISEDQNHGSWSQVPVPTIQNGQSLQAFSIDSSGGLYGSTGWAGYNLTSGTTPSILYLMFNNPYTQGDEGQNGQCWFYAVIEQGSVFTPAQVAVTGFSVDPVDPAQQDTMNVIVTLTPISSSSTSDALTLYASSDSGQNVVFSCSISYVDSGNAMILSGLSNGHQSPPAEVNSSAPEVASVIIGAYDATTAVLAYQTAFAGGIMPSGAPDGATNTFAYTLPDLSVLTVTVSYGGGNVEVNAQFGAAGSMYEVIPGTVTKNITAQQGQYNYSTVYYYNGTASYSFTVQMQNATSSGA